MPLIFKYNLLSTEFNKKSKICQYAVANSFHSYDNMFNYFVKGEVGLPFGGVGKEVRIKSTLKGGIPVRNAAYEDVRGAQNPYLYPTPLGGWATLLRFLPLFGQSATGGESGFPFTWE